MPDIGRKGTCRVCGCALHVVCVQGVAYWAHVNPDETNMDAHTAEPDADDDGSRYFGVSAPVG